MWPDNYDRDDLIPKGVKVYRNNDQIFTGKCEFHEYSDMDKIIGNLKKEQTMRDDIKRWLPKGTEIKEVKFGDTVAYNEAISESMTGTDKKPEHKEAPIQNATKEPEHPDYYKGTNDGGRSIEVFDIIDQFVNGDFYLGNVLKYVCRAGKKSKNTKRQDLEKALHYIKEAIKRCGEPEQEDK